jgi:hypothetical protein
MIEKDVGTLQNQISDMFTREVWQKVKTSRFNLEDIDNLFIQLATVEMFLKLREVLETALERHTASLIGKKRGPTFKHVGQGPSKRQRV